MKIAWLTDIHLNFLDGVDGPRAFGLEIAQKVDCNSAVVSGDISESRTLQEHWTGFLAGLGKPAYFVLGNHDYYGSSLRRTDKRAAKLPNWLTQMGVVELTPETALIGNESWYDALLGDPKSDFEMTDWLRNKDFRSKVRRYERDGAIMVAQYLSLQAVKAIQSKLEQAFERYPLAVLVVHVPPFEQSSKYDLRTSPIKTLPWYTSKLLGDMLLKQMYSRPHRRLLVLCGHTHHAANYAPLKNLHVLTGHAVYRSPNLSGLIHLEGNHVEVDLRLSNGWERVRPFR